MYDVKFIRVYVTCNFWQPQYHKYSVFICRYPQFCILISNINIFIVKCFALKVQMFACAVFFLNKWHLLCFLFFCSLMTSRHVDIFKWALSVLLVKNKSIQRDVGRDICCYLIICHRRKWFYWTVMPWHFIWIKMSLWLWYTWFACVLSVQETRFL